MKTRTALSLVILAFSALQVCGQERVPQVSAAVAPEWPHGLVSRSPINKVVQVRVTIDGFGNVVEANVISGPKGLVCRPQDRFEAEALNAAKDWKFGPDVRTGDHAVLKFRFRQLPSNVSKHDLRTSFIVPFKVVVSQAGPRAGK